MIFQFNMIRSIILTIFVAVPKRQPLFVWIIAVNLMSLS